MDNEALAIANVLKASVMPIVTIKASLGQKDAQSTTRITGDKYATQDYMVSMFPKNRPSNHWKGRSGVQIGRNIVRLDGSAQWDN